MNVMHSDPSHISAPKHVAIIMDGNGRWASKSGLKRIEGHKEGVRRVEDIVEVSVEEGVKYLTLYTFSTENWSRPSSEVNFLLSLLSKSIVSKIPKMKEKGVRFHTIGDLQRMPSALRTQIENAIAQTQENDRLRLILALNYSGRWEIEQMAKRIASKALKGDISVDAINSDTIERHLDTADFPFPDLLIRTGGEYRISNFLLYQIAYAELFFTDTCWPQFSKQEFKHIIKDFQSRTRTFGGLNS